MCWKRLLGLYAAIVFCFWVVLCRLYVVACNTGYAARARRQTVTTLELPPARGNFLDRNGVRLTGTGTGWYALCVPGEDSYTRLFDFAQGTDQKLLYRRRNARTPFLVQVNRDLSPEGIFTVPQPVRYPELPLCPHLIGYLDAAGQGVAGLEQAMDTVLAGTRQQAQIHCVTNGRGALMHLEKPRHQPGTQSSRDVQLTLDSAMQAAVEGIGAGMLTRGCILVLDTATAQVLACASFPAYHPQQVAAAIAGGQSALMNRVFSPYAVGSVFKPLLAAIAVEEGLPDEAYDCPGYINWHGQIYRCAGGIPHGEVHLQQALEKSCNGYFVQLGSRIGAETLHAYSEALGFGQPIYLTGGLKAAAGNLPDAQTLQNAGSCANFSFGQGELLATPLQIGVLLNTLAGDGCWRAPSFLLEIRDGQTGATVEPLTTGFAARHVFRPATTAALRQMLAGVVTDGLGREAAPAWENAGGKTGTAQTGRFAASGEEYKNLWFAGFFPAEKPRYTVVVLQDDQLHAAYSSAAVFARVCDALYLLTQPPARLASAPPPAEKG